MDTTRCPVTVVVPTANRPLPLRLTLGSILAQRGVDVRVVVVDDGGDEATHRWLAGLADPRVELLVHDRSRGAASARNTGLDATTTEWVAFCDDDDLWSPTKLATQLAATQRDDTAWSCTGAVCVDDDLRVIDHQRLPQGGDVLDAVLATNVVPGGGSGVLARADVVRDVGAFDPTTPASEDWDLWIRLAERGPIAAVDAPHVGYRIWAGGKSRDTDRLASGFEVIERRYGALAAARGVGPDWRAHRRWLAKQGLRNGDRRGAAEKFVDLARDGDRRLWPRAAAALLAPRLTDRVGTWRATRQVPPTWRVAAERWLADLRPADELPPSVLAPA